MDTPTSATNVTIRTTSVESTYGKSNKSLPGKKSTIEWMYIDVLSYGESYFHLHPFAMLVYWSATEQYGHTNHVTYKSSSGFHKSLVQPKYSWNLWTDFPYSRHI